MSDDRRRLDAADAGPRGSDVEPTGEGASPLPADANSTGHRELGDAVDAAAVVTTDDQAADASGGRNRRTLLDLLPLSNDAIPTLEVVHRAGPEDWLFDLLLVLGPVVLLLIAVVGRSLLTQALAAGYVLALVGGVLARALGVDAWR